MHLGVSFRRKLSEEGQSEHQSAAASTYTGRGCLEVRLREQKQQEAGRSVSWRLWAGLTPKESFGLTQPGSSEVMAYIFSEVARKVQC